MTEPENSHPKDRVEELSVTEVSDQVLQELSGLFGTRESENISESVDIIELNDMTITDVVDLADVVTKDDTPQELDREEFETIVISDISIDVSPRVEPIDPLLNGMADDAGTLVVIDDDLDRVVIVDDDRPDSTFEERQRRSRRRERLQKVKWLKLAGAVAASVVVVIALLASPIFAIRSVTVEGNVYTSKEVLAAVTKTLKGASVFTVDTQRARELLLEDSWVSDVRITTRFPGKALVEIAERVPIIWYVGDDQKARIVDARGRIIAVLDGWPTKYLRVTGVGPSLEAGATADDVYRAAAQLVLALPDELRPLVKSLEVSPGGELAMTLKGGTLVRFGPPNDLQDKLVAVVVLLRRQNPSTLAVIDVSTGDPTVQVR
ncbi:MAG: FtsQ-type POTRA domain-containing protein [Ilumatobacteraceae bacterium]|jgi:cell division septal protein FtsQ|nr:FtsQ-type POTRA domain-containing protein [Ilumatobacteraceae bacterium]MDP5069153.1 FtsQ-type POTRA domain-containing protein [Ilumatobacteraceae bacterium]